MHDSSGADPLSAFLTAVVVGPATTSPLTVDLDRTLRDAGHDVTLVTGAPTGASTGGAATPAAVGRAVPLLGWVRLDTWASAGRRMRDADLIVLVHSGALGVPALLALLHGAGATGAVGAEGGRGGGRRPRVVLVAEAALGRPMPTSPTSQTSGRADGAGRAGGADRADRAGGAGRAGRYAAARLTAALVRRVDAVLAHDAATAAVATELGADRVSVAARPAAPTSPATPRSGVHRGVLGGVPVGVPVGVHRGGRTRVAIDALAEVRRGLVVGSRGPMGHDGGADHDGGAGGDDDVTLSADWAHYVGVLEALASPPSRLSPGSGAGPGPGRGVRADGGAPPVTRSVRGLLAARLTTVLDGSRELIRAARAPGAPGLLQRGDFPEWVGSTDVLIDAADGDDARAVAGDLGLATVADGAAAWSALGALAAIIRIVDDGHRSAVVVDESGPRSPLTPWARTAGFAPVSLGLGGAHRDPSPSDLAPSDLAPNDLSPNDLAPNDLPPTDLEIETFDAIVKVHPGGCDADDIDELIASSSWLLRPGGVLVVTVPLGPAGRPGAMVPADVRGVVARADGFGFTLVGDLDGGLTSLMTAAAAAAADSAAAADVADRAASAATGPAYGLVRLTFRRQ